MILDRSRKRRRRARLVASAIALGVPAALFLMHPVLRDVLVQTLGRRAEERATARATRRAPIDPITRLAAPPVPGAGPVLESPEEHVRRAAAAAARREARADGRHPAPPGDPRHLVLGGPPADGPPADGPPADGPAAEPADPGFAAGDAGGQAAPTVSTTPASRRRQSALAAPDLALARSEPAFDGSPVPTRRDPTPEPQPGTTPLAQPELWPEPPNPYDAPPVTVDPYSH
jgi:hypothetical protein